VPVHGVEVHVHGVDLDADSVEEARRHAAEAGLDDRTTFAVGDAAELAPEETYDLVCILEALHDTGDPVATLRGVRRVLTPTAHGAVLRTPTVRDRAGQAGWAGVDVLPVEHVFWRSYRFHA
jgi:ubiquinone/menaquinone biosynthesis C-methylase UbiE